MAEFTETMKQAKRLCEAFNDGHCSDCPIGNAGALECGIAVTAEMDCEEVERRIMQWAKEHPEPVYPTWSEWQNSMFQDADGDMSPCEFGSGDRFNCAKKTCAECREQQIPADIAEKLGIKPVATKGQETVHNGCAGCKHVLKSLLDDPCAKCRGWTLIAKGNEHGKLWEEG